LAATLCEEIYKFARDKQSSNIAKMSAINKEAAQMRRLLNLFFKAKNA